MPERNLNKEENSRKRAQIVAVFENDGDWKTLAHSLNVKMPTAYRWVKEGMKDDPRGGFRWKKLQDQHKEFMISEIESNPRITLRQLGEKLSESYNIVVSKECIRNHLEGAMYTLKAIRYEPESGNSQVNKEKRKAFAESLLKYQGEDCPILFMDETNFNLHISRSEGRSTRGTRCSTVAAGSRGANIHVIGCISHTGLVHYEIRRGSFTKELAHEWVKTCLRKARLIFSSNVGLVIDNAPCHSAIEEILKEEEFSNHKILRLAPYSPMLNPIESVWSVIKSNVKSVLAETIMGILSREAQGHLTMKEFRLQQLEKAIKNSITIITPSMCYNMVIRIQGLLPGVINLNDVYY